MISKKHTRGTTARKSRRDPRRISKRAEIEDSVKVGIERFILKDSTIADFMKTIRAATEKEYVYSHQLTKKRFLQIVKQAIRKRNLRLKREKQR